MEIVVNRCFGGYSLSKDAYKFLGMEWDGFGYIYEGDRTNPKLIDCIRHLGHEANGRCAKLEIIDIPEGANYYIDEYDGQEIIREAHSSW